MLTLPVAGKLPYFLLEHTAIVNVSISHTCLISQIALSVKKAAEDYAPMAEGSEAHWEVVERILFLYAKLNPGQGYVQGMNEIVGPIYHCFASNPEDEWRCKYQCYCLTG